MAVKKNGRPNPAKGAPVVEIGLYDPGMTSILRAGLGGLAATLYALSGLRGQSWKGETEVEGAKFLVQDRSVRIEWGSKTPDVVLETLLRKSFCIDCHGIMYCSGWFSGNLSEVDVLASLQDALKATFLQHGKSTKADALKEETSTSEIDGKFIRTSYRRFRWFAHQGALEELLEALRSGTAKLPVGIVSGTVVRHVGFSSATEYVFDFKRVFAALFAIVGCISLNLVGQSGGVVIVPEPNDLVVFARRRSNFTPSNVKACFSGGIGDALLKAEVLRMIKGQRREYIQQVSAYTTTVNAWARQQKVRDQILSDSAVSDDAIRLYESLTGELPAEVRLLEKPADGKSNYFVGVSAFRAFAAENIARGKPWHENFSSARTNSKPPRAIHYLGKGKNLGALFDSDRKGIQKMEEGLKDEEKILVEAVHEAMRSRFAQLYDEARSSGVNVKNRIERDRERWRIAFSGAKTLEQLRRALVEFWSRAGSNKRLQDHWPTVLSFMKEARWAAARDLSLVALVSYKTQSKDEIEALEEKRNQSEDEAFSEGD